MACKHRSGEITGWTRRIRIGITLKIHLDRNTRVGGLSGSYWSSRSALCRRIQARGLWEAHHHSGSTIHVHHHVCILLCMSSLLKVLRCNQKFRELADTVAGAFVRAEFNIELMFLTEELELLGMKAFVSHQPVISDGQTMGTVGMRFAIRSFLKCSGFELYSQDTRSSAET